MVDVTDIQTDMSCWWYDRRMVDATDIWTDMSYGWYDRRASRLLHLNHACDATPPLSAQVGVIVLIKILLDLHSYWDYLDDTPSQLGFLM